MTSSRTGRGPRRWIEKIGQSGRRALTYHPIVVSLSLSMGRPFHSRNWAAPHRGLYDARPNRSSRSFGGTPEGRLSPVYGTRPPIRGRIALSRQRLACHSSSRLSKTYAAVLIDHKPPMIDSALQGCIHRSPAENHPPLHRPPIGELVELPAQVTGCLIGRSTLVHALSLQTAPSSEHRLSGADFMVTLLCPTTERRSGQRRAFPSQAHAASILG